MKHVNFRKKINKLIKGKLFGGVIKLLLASNLLLISTGSAELLTATESANITDQSETSTTQEASQLVTQVNTDPKQARASIEENIEFMNNLKDKTDSGGQYFNDRLIVKFKDGFAEQEKINLLKGKAAVFIREDLNLLGAKVIKVHPQNLEWVYLVLKNNPNVEWVEKSAVYLTQGDGGYIGGGGGFPGGGTYCYPNDPKYCDNTQQSVKQVFSNQGWPLFTGQGDIIVAVVDTGVDYNHPELSGKVIKGNDHVYPWEFDTDPMDENGHGTFIAGIISAKTNNGSGIAGVNWHAPILAIRSCDQWGTCDPSAVASGINEAANEYPDLPVKVINLSLHGLYSTAISNAVVNAQNKGITVVAGVANSPAGSTNCNMGYPAALFNVISVVAIKQDWTHGSGCTNPQGGQEVQMSAPGEKVHSLNISSLGGGTKTILGTHTSFAAPHVSAVAAMIASCVPNADPFFVRNYLRSGAYDIGSVGNDPIFGFGSVNIFGSMQNIVNNCGT